jgi:TatA/E family protein of Tat protein translocase
MASIFGADGLIVLAVVVLVVFGSALLPKLAKNLRTAPKEFEQARAEGDGTVEPRN